MDTDGEYFTSNERVLVSPAAGVFVPTMGLPPTIDPGATLGHVRSTHHEVPVVSAFGGRLMAMDAEAGQRVTEHQRLGWLRAV